MSNAPESRENEGLPDSPNAEVDLSLLEDSLAMTPWERMKANDDAVNFADALRGALLERNAKPE